MHQTHSCHFEWSVNECVCPLQVLVNLHKHWVLEKKWMGQGLCLVVAFVGKALAPSHIVHPSHILWALHSMRRCATAHFLVPVQPVLLLPREVYIFHSAKGPPLSSYVWNQDSLHWALTGKNQNQSSKLRSAHSITVTHNPRTTMHKPSGNQTHMSLNQNGKCGDNKNHVSGYLLWPVIPPLRRIWEKLQPTFLDNPFPACHRTTSCEPHACRNPHRPHPFATQLHVHM